MTAKPIAIPIAAAASLLRAGLAALCRYYRARRIAARDRRILEAMNAHALRDLGLSRDGLSSLRRR